MSVTDRPNNDDKGPWKAITIAITVEKDEYRVKDGEPLTFTEDELELLMRAFARKDNPMTVSGEADGETDTTLRDQGA